MEISASNSKEWLEHLEIGNQISDTAIWRRLLNEWCSVMNDYAVRSVSRNGWAKGRGGDLAYWNKERANVGFLAAAVWRLGGVTIQEFEVTRPRTKDAKGDLWFELGGLNCQVEAKDTMSVHTDNPDAQTIEYLLRDARMELSELPNREKAPLGVVIVFVVPGVQGVSFDFRSLMRQVQNDRRITAIYRPGRDSNILDDEDVRDRLNYPGIAMVGELVWGELIGEQSLPDN